MGMLRTVTLNTGYDDYYTVTGMAWGGLGRMEDYRSVCSGKGISCARTAVALGLPVRAYALVGAHDISHYSSQLTAEGIDHELLAVPGRTRHNLTLLDGHGQEVGAHFVAAGFTLDGPLVIASLFDRLLDDVEAGDVVTLNGSIPTGLPDTTWADLARACLDRGARVIVDAQQAAFRAALDVPGLTAFKPNDTEIDALPGVTDAPADERVSLALRQLAATGAQIPLVSLGEQGVAFLRDGVPVVMSCPVDEPVAAVMAGDAFVAGLAEGVLAGLGAEDCLRRGLAAAAAHVAGLSGDALRRQAADNLHRVAWSSSVDAQPHLDGHLGSEVGELVGGHRRAPE